MYTQEFFNKLKGKFKNDIEEFFKYKGVDQKRLEILKEVYKSLDEYKKFIESQVKKPSPKAIPLERVTAFGEANGWPAMVLKRDGDKIIKILNKGKDNWDNAIAWYKLNEPYKSNFNDLVNAVDKGDTWHTKE